MQRLRRISQMSMAQQVYPSATGQRFAHSLGTAHLAQVAWRALLDRSMHYELSSLWPLIRNDLSGQLSDPALVLLVGDALAAAALLHDVGHTPFSHTLEEPLRPVLSPYLPEHRNDVALHEQLGLVIAERLLDDIGSRSNRAENWREFSSLTLRILRASTSSGTWASALHGLIASQVDVDRMDYLQRDTRGTGTEYGRINYQRILDSLELQVRGGSVTVLPGARARPAVERLLSEREQAYRWIYLHPRVLTQEFCLARAVELLVQLGTDDTQLPPDAHAPTLGALFRGVEPDFNYVRSTGSSDELEQQTLSLFDDATIYEWLKASFRLLARLPEGILPAVAREALACIRAVLFRDKPMRAVWKNYEGYQETAAAVVLSEEFRKHLLAEEARRTNRRGAAKLLLTEARTDPTRSFTRLLRAATVWTADPLDQYLARSATDGTTWFVISRKYRAVQSDSYLLVDDEARSFNATSPLIQALDDFDQVISNVFIVVDNHRDRATASLRATLVTLLQPYLARAAIADYFDE